MKPGDLIIDKTRDNMQGIIVEKDHRDSRSGSNDLLYDYLVLYCDGELRPVDAFALGEIDEAG